MVRTSSSAGIRSWLLRRALLQTSALVGCALAAPQAWAQSLPTTPQMSGGATDVEIGDTSMTFTLKDAANRVFTYERFDIAEGNAVRFVATDTSVPTTVMNIVQGPFESKIDGALVSSNNIRLWLVNPEGITFGPTGSFRGGSLVLSTLDAPALSSGDWGTEATRFQGTRESSIKLSAGSGTIETADGGSIVVVGQRIEAGKTINASGSVAFAAGTNVYFPSGVDSPLFFQIDAGTLAPTPGVKITGAIAAQAIGIRGSAETQLTAALLNVAGEGSLTATATGDGVVLMSSSAVTVAGNVSSAGEYKVIGSTVTLGETDMAHAQTAAGLVTITATTGALEAAGGLHLQANSDGMGDEALTLRGTTAVDLDPASLLEGGTLEHRSDVLIDWSSATATNLGDVRARSLRSVGESGLVAQRMELGSITVTSDLDILATTGSITATALHATGRIKVAANAGDVAIDAMSSAADIDITANGAARIGGDVDAQNDYTIMAGSVELGRDGTMTTQSAGAGVTINATNGITGSGQLTLQTNGDFGPSRALKLVSTAGPITFSAASHLIGGSNGPAADVIVSGVGALTLGDVTARRLVSEDGSPTLAVAGGTTLGTVKLSDAFDLVGNGAVTIAALQSSRAISLQGRSGGIVLVSAAAHDGITIRATGDDASIRIGSAEAETGSIQIEANDDISGLALDSPASDGRMLAGYDRADLTAGGAGSSISVDSDRGTVQLGTVTVEDSASEELGGNLTVHAKAADLLRASAYRDIEIRANEGDVAAGSLQGRRVDVFAAKHARIYGDVAAGAGGYLVHADAITLGGAGIVQQRALGDVLLQADGALLNSGESALVGLGALTVQSNGNGLGGQLWLRADNGAIQFAPASTVQAGTDASPSLVAITSTSHVALGTVKADVLRSFDSISRLLVHGDVTLGPVTVQQSLDVRSIGGSIVAGDLVSTSGGITLTTLAGGITVGTGTAALGIGLDSAADLRLGLAYSASGDIALAAAGDLTGLMGIGFLGDLPPLADYGRAVVTTDGDKAGVNIRAGGIAQLGTVIAGQLGGDSLDGTQIDVSAERIDLLRASALQGDIALTAGAGGALIGALDGDSISVDAGGNATLYAAVTARDDYSVTADTVTLGGAPDISQRAAGVVTIHARALAPDLDASTTIAGIGALTLSSGGEIRLQADHGGIVFDAASVVNAGAADSRAGLSIASGAHLSLGTVAARSMRSIGNATDLVVPTDVVLGTVTLDQALHLATIAGSVTGSGITIRDAGGALAISAGGSGSIVVPGELRTNDGDISLHSGGDQRIGSVTAGGSIDIEAGGVVGGPAGVGATLRANGNVTASAGGATLDLVDAGGDIDLTTGGVLFARQLQSNTNILVRHASDLWIGNATATGSIELHADGAIGGLAGAGGAGAVLHAGAFVQIAAGWARFDDIETDGGISLTTDGVLFARRLQADATIDSTAGADQWIGTATSGTYMNLNAGGMLGGYSGADGTGAVLSAARTLFVGANGVKIEDVRAGDMVLTSDGLLFARALQADMVIVAFSQGEMRIGNATADGEIRLATYGLLGGMAGADGPGAVLHAKEKVFAYGAETRLDTVEAGLDIETGSDGVLVAGTLVAGGNITTFSTTDQRIGSATAGGSIDLRVGGALAGLPADGAGVVLAADQKVTVTAGTTAMLDTVQARDDVVLAAGGLLTIRSAVSSGTVDVEANGTQVTLRAGAIDVQTLSNQGVGDILVSAAGNLVVTDATAALGSIALLGGGSLVSVGTLAATEDVSVAVAGDARFGTLRAGDDLDLLAGGTMFVTDAATSGLGSDGRAVTFTSAEAGLAGGIGLAGETPAMRGSTLRIRAAALRGPDLAGSAADGLEIGALQAASATLTAAAGDIRVRDVRAAGAVQVDATRGSVTGLSEGWTALAGGARLASAGKLVFGVRGAIEAGTVLAATDISTEADAGSIRIAGLTAGSVNLVADTALRIDNGAIAGAASLRTTGGGAGAVSPPGGPLVIGYGRGAFTASADTATLQISSAGAVQTGLLTAGTGLQVRSGAIDVGAVDVRFGTAQLSATTGRLALGTSGSGGSTGGGSAGPLAVPSGGASSSDLTIEADGDINLGSIGSTTGSIFITSSQGSVTGLGTISAASAGGTVKITAPGAIRVAGIQAGVQGGTIAGEQISVTGQSIDLGAADARSGAMSLRASDGALTLGATTVAGSATLVKRGAGTLRVTAALTAGGDVLLDSQGDIEIGGAVSANGAGSRITVRNAGAGATAIGDDRGDASFQLNQAEMNRLTAATVIIDSGAQNLTIGTLALAAGTGSGTLAFTSTGAVRLTGALTGATGGVVQIGGSGIETPDNVVDPGRLATTFSADIGAGASIALDQAVLDLRAQRIVVGDGTLLGRYLPSGGAAADPAAVARDVENSGSELYRANSSQSVFLTARTLRVSYSDFAVFQNTGGASSAGVTLNEQAGPNSNALALQLFSGGEAKQNVFALFGRVNGFSDRAAGLLPNANVEISSGGVIRVTRASSRLNGCVIGSPERGCLQTDVAVPDFTLRSQVQTALVAQAQDDSLFFNPLVGRGNEGLIVDIVEAPVNLDRIDCPPGGGAGAGCGTEGGTK